VAELWLRRCDCAFDGGGALDGGGAAGGWVVGWCCFVSVVFDFWLKTVVVCAFFDKRLVG